MKVQITNNSNKQSFGMKKFNVLSKATKSLNQYTYEEHNELRKTMEKFVREKRKRHSNAIQSVNEFFKKILLKSGL